MVAIFLCDGLNNGRIGVLNLRDKIFSISNLHLSNLLAAFSTPSHNQTDLS